MGDAYEYLMRNFATESGKSKRQFYTLAELSEDAVRLAVVSRLPWIRRRQARMLKQRRQSEREFVSGETHYFEGRPYRLDVIEVGRRSGVRLPNRGFIEFRVPQSASRSAREAAMHRWYRRKLQARLPKLREEWEPKVGVRLRELRIKRMKTLWRLPAGNASN